MLLIVVSSVQGGTKSSFFNSSDERFNGLSSSHEQFNMNCDQRRSMPLSLD